MNQLRQSPKHWNKDRIGGVPTSEHLRGRIQAQKPPSRSQSWGRRSKPIKLLLTKESSDDCWKPQLSSAVLDPGLSAHPPKIKGLLAVLSRWSSCHFLLAETPAPGTVDVVKGLEKYRLREPLNLPRGQQWALHPSLGHYSLFPSAETRVWTTEHPHTHAGR